MTSCAVMPPITACMGHTSPAAEYAKLRIKSSLNSSCFAASVEASFTFLATATNFSASSCGLKVKGGKKMWIYYKAELKSSMLKEYL